MARSTLILLYSGIYSAIFFMLFSVSINSMLCLDLILMVRYPFDRKEPRVIKYILASVCLALPPAILLTFRPLILKWMRVGAAITIAYICIYFILFLTSVIYTWSKLRGPSFSKEVRYLVLKRHIITSCVYLLSNFYIFISMIMILVWDLDQIYHSHETTDSWYIKVFKIMFASQGFLIPILRLSEPFFFQVIVQKIKNTCMKIRNFGQQKKKQEENDERFLEKARAFRPSFIVANESIQGEAGFS